MAASTSPFMASRMRRGDWAILAAVIALHGLVFGLLWWLPSPPPEPLWRPALVAALVQPEAPAPVITPPKPLPAKPRPVVQPTPTPPVLAAPEISPAPNVCWSPRRSKNRRPRRRRNLSRSSRRHPRRRLSRWRSSRRVSTRIISTTPRRRTRYCPSACVRRGPCWCGSTSRPTACRRSSS